MLLPSASNAFISSCDDPLFPHDSRLLSCAKGVRLTARHRMARARFYLVGALTSYGSNPSASCSAAILKPLSRSLSMSFSYPSSPSSSASPPAHNPGHALVHWRHAQRSLHKALSASRRCSLQHAPTQCYTVVLQTAGGWVFHLPCQCGRGLLRPGCPEVRLCYAGAQGCRHSRAGCTPHHPMHIGTNQDPRLLHHSLRSCPIFTHQPWNTGST